MDEDSLRHRNNLGSALCPVKGMESVVASVSGYHGVERFNLIKLIDRTGASYAGNMTPSFTHLVCRRFEGRKYEFAMKFGIKIVNHCWVEECMKKGRRVAEEPYTYRSGEEMGPFVLDNLLGIDQKKARSKDLKKAKRPLVDIELEDMNDVVWKDSVLLDEDLSPKKRQNNYGSSRSIEKAIKKSSRKDCPSSSRHGLQKQSTTEIVELDDSSTSQAAYSCRQEKRNSTSPEFRPRRRRLVKRPMSLKDWLRTSDDEDECDEVKVLPENKSHAGQLGSSEVERHQITSDWHVSNIGSTLTGFENVDAHVQEIEHLDDDDEIEAPEHLHHENQNSHAPAAPSSFAISEKLQEAAEPDATEKDSSPTSSSVSSCAICLRVFSSTLGILSCGHRYCFSCIKKWGDQETSSGKTALCPMCKESFKRIIVLGDAVSSDQKIYSQSIPNDSLKTRVYVLDDAHSSPSNLSPSVCFVCRCREPADLLKSCYACSSQCIHTFCLDPPLLPWTCGDCMRGQLVNR